MRDRIGRLINLFESVCTTVIVHEGTKFRRSSPHCSLDLMGLILIRLTDQIKGLRTGTSAASDCCIETASNATGDHLTAMRAVLLLYSEVNRDAENLVIHGKCK